jgi:hypothetical protein
VFESILLKGLNRADNKCGKTVVAGKAIMYHRMQANKKLKTLYFALCSAETINRKLLVGMYLILMFLRSPTDVLIYY